MKKNEFKFGEKLSLHLIKIEEMIWVNDLAKTGAPNYSNEGFRASIKIFMSILLDKMFELQHNENMSMEDKSNMCRKAGEDIRKLIKTYTGIDTYDIYKINHKK